MTVDPGMIQPARPKGRDGKTKTTGGRKVDTLDVGELQNDLGTVYGVGLILSNPELLVLAYRSQGFDNARIDPATGKVTPGKRNSGSEWDDSLIQAEIVKTNWYKTNDGNRRMAQNAKFSDPGSWATKVNNVAGSLRRKAAEMGADLTDADLTKDAEQMLTDHYGVIGGQIDTEIPDSLLRSYLAPRIKPTAEGRFTGSSEVTAQTLREKARQYGVKFADKWYTDAVQKLQSGSITADVLDNEIISAAKSRYPTMANMIDVSRSTMALASTYIQSMAETLELDPNALDLDTPEIQNALTFMDPSTSQVRSKTLYEFENDLRKDPRWESTKNGRQTFQALGNKLLKEWGFVQ